MNAETRIGEAVHRAIRTEIERIVAEEAAAAAERVVKRVREMTGQIAATVLEKFSMETRGNQLCIIRVDFMDYATK